MRAARSATRSWTTGWALARALRGLGAGPGSRVAYLGPNHPAFLETMFATWSAGAVFVPLNMRLAGPELAYQLADCGAELLVYAPEQAAVVAGIRGQARPGHLVALNGAASGEHDYESLLAGPPPEPADIPVSLDDPCLIMYTSGTTGRPKGATLTHGNITWNAVNVVVDADFLADEVRPRGRPAVPHRGAEHALPARPCSRAARC